MRPKSKSFQEVYNRILEVTETRTQIELAEFLGIRQSSISDALRRESIPSDWILAIFEQKGILPSWIRTGEGSRYPSAENFSDLYQREQVYQAVIAAMKSISPELVQKITDKTVEILRTNNEDSSMV